MQLKLLSNQLVIVCLYLFIFHVKIIENKNVKDILNYEILLNQYVRNIIILKVQDPNITIIYKSFRALSTMGRALRRASNG